MKPKSHILRIETKLENIGILRMDERVLLKRLKHKSEKALGETIEKYTSYVTTIIREILYSKATVQDIEELVADTFIALWMTADRIDYEQYSSLKAYIGMIARNKAKDYLRKNKNIDLELFENVILIADNIENQMLQKEQQQYIKKLLSKLKQEDQKIFLLHYYQYKKIEEIASIMQMNPQTVKTRLRRGRETLRALLCDEENAEYEYKN